MPRRAAHHAPADRAAPHSLAAYRAKRAFGVTPEPAPAAAPVRRGPLLFVVQHHVARREHYDLRLELEGVLKSWAVPKCPSLEPSHKRLALRTEDHPFEYAAFEGAIPAGQYGSGVVRLWDCGVYTPCERGEHLYHDRERAERRAAAALKAGKLVIFLRGTKLKGAFALVRSGGTGRWLLVKQRDRFAGGAFPAAPPSCAGGTAALAPAGSAERLPDRLSPMFAESADAPFTHPDWLHEPKLDGYRVIAALAGERATLRSRRGLDLSGQFPEITEALAEQAASAMLLDGELVAFGPDGRPSFNALQNRARLHSAREIAAAARSAPCVLYCFDLLHFAGVNLRSAPYAARRRYLAQCLLPHERLQRVHAQPDGEALYAAALATGLEGTMAKRLDSRYAPGRRASSWLKVKAARTADLVIGGYTSGKGERAPLGALLLGERQASGVLRYAGNVGTGFDAATLAQLERRLAARRQRDSPFAPAPKVARARWVRPELVAEVKFAERTPGGRLRAPVFVRLRDDLSGSGDVLAQLESPRASFELAVGPARIKLTHLDRVYWPPAHGRPAVRKRDYLAYLVKVAPFMLPHLADRPLTLVRCPEGIDGERFFQRRWDLPRPGFVETAGEHLLCNNLATLLWLAQHGTLELHAWHARAGGTPPGVAALEHPDYLVFDLDPYVYAGSERPGEEPRPNPAGFEKCKDVALELHELLEELGLRAIVKTSGRTGLHVFVPIVRSVGFGAAREACRSIGRYLMRRRRELITLEWSVSSRTGRVFMDYAMNVRGKTLAAAYSPRAAAGAPVSTPVRWDELPSLRLGEFGLADVPARLARLGDPWRAALDDKQDLHAVLGAKRAAS